MRFRRPRILLIAAAVLASGCSSSNSDAPLPGEAHPAAWLTAHAAAAAADLDGCRACHGGDFTGSGDAVSCFACHVFNTAPPFTVHPAAWDDVYDDHGAYAAENGFASCAVAACHGTGEIFPLGGETAPSCAAASFDGRACHADGPIPHDLSFSDPEDHGRAAREDLAFCQLCHGTPGTILFDGGSVQTACSSCHPDADAHPTRWQGDNDITPDYPSSHRSARNLSIACAICHNVLAAGAGPHPGAPSCFSASFTNAEDVVANICHPGGPIPHTLEATWLLLNDGHVDAFDANDPPCFDCHTVAPVAGGTYPACMECHTLADPTVAPRDCASCHGTPPADPSTLLAARPDREGAHDAHGALPPFPGQDDCSACHLSAGSDTLLHFDNSAPADVLPDTALYNALGTAPARRNADGSCSGVICHGGQTTPAWLTGTLAVNASCTSCHASDGDPPAQYNDYRNPGEDTHDFHLGRNVPNSLPGGGRDIFCTDCHNTATLAAEHFTTLETPAMAGPANTVGGGTTFVNTYDGNTGNCTVDCHGGETWGGGD